MKFFIIIVGFQLISLTMKQYVWMNRLLDNQKLDKIIKNIFLYKLFFSAIYFYILNIYL